MPGNAAVADRMRRAAALMRVRGLRVEAFSGWATAGRSSTMRPRAVTVHHTAAAVDVDRVLRDGRPTVPGPLCNWALHRDGSWWLVASGRANHAGVGWLPSSESFGIEATGPVPITATGIRAFPNYDEYVLGVACILQVEGWPVSRVYAHKETAQPDCRKIDPAFGDPCPKPYKDMDLFRGRVAAVIGGAVPPDEEDLPVDQTTFNKLMNGWATTKEAKQWLDNGAERGSTTMMRKATGPDDASVGASVWFDRKGNLIEQIADDHGVGG
jgi:hypothetical protein